MKDLSGLVPLILLVLLTGCCLSKQPAKTSSPPETDFTHQPNPHHRELLTLVQKNNHVSVLVELALETTPEGKLSKSEVIKQRNRIRKTQSKLLSALADTDYTVIRRYSLTPILALRVSEEALKVLINNPLIRSISKDRPKRLYQTGTS